MLQCETASPYVMVPPGTPTGEVATISYDRSVLIRVVNGRDAYSALPAFKLFPNPFHVIAGRTSISVGYQSGMMHSTSDVSLSFDIKAGQKAHIYATTVSPTKWRAFVKVEGAMVATPTMRPRIAEEPVDTSHDVRYPDAKSSFDPSNPILYKSDFTAWYARNHLSSLSIPPGSKLAVMGHCSAGSDAKERSKCSHKLAVLVTKALMEQGFPKNNLTIRSGLAEHRAGPKEENFVTIGIRRRPTPAWSEYEGFLNYKDAREKCEAMALRLPTKEELIMTHESGANLKTWDSPAEGTYWSSTPEGDDSAYIVNMHDGISSVQLRTASQDVRCVRAPH